MKLKIKIKVLTEGCMPEINPKGDWIDLRSAKDIELKAATVDQSLKINIPVTYIPLGIAVELPKGFEAIIASRSSGPKKLRLFIPCGKGIVDNIFNGNNDEWNYIASPLYDTYIKKGDRVCQFRIQLSQNATIWQKLKWNLCSGIKLVQVDKLNGHDRGGLGSSGIH